MNTNGASISEGAARESDATREILLPNQQKDEVQIAVDIGGSLAKVAWFTPSSAPGDGGRLSFVKFETARMDELTEFLRAMLPPRGRRVIKATGGGAYKYEAQLAAELGVVVEKTDEMASLIRGLNFLVSQIPNEVFTYDERADAENPMRFEEMCRATFPYLLVNIGSGVSIIKVTGAGQFERVSGTSLGGGTLWGLLSVLTPAHTYDEMLEFSKQGDNAAVDMLVGDIYGTDYAKIGLKSSTIASSFAKVFKAAPEARRELRPEDISRSLLYAISNNIGQIAYLNAQRYDINRIYFGGCFIRGHPITMNSLSYAIQFWSKGEMTALFLRHEGYLGALGAFLDFADDEAALGGSSLGERVLEATDDSSRTPRVGPAELSAPNSPRRGSDGNTGASSPLSTSYRYLENFTSPSRIAPASVSFVGVLERTPTPLVPLPQLSHLSRYNPDLLDLTYDVAAQTYWIDLFENGLSKLTEAALQWEAHAGATLSARMQRAGSMSAMLRPAAAETASRSASSPAPGAPAEAPAENAPQLYGGLDVDKRADVEKRAAQFVTLYSSHLQRLRREPGVYGHLTVRSLLILREQCLQQLDFDDIFAPIKQSENNAALACLPMLLQEVDRLPDFDGPDDIVDVRGVRPGSTNVDRLRVLLDNMLAGNMYDWGAMEMLASLRAGTMDFQVAKDKLRRSQTLDHYLALRRRLQAGQPRHRKAVIFVDNAGADIVLGVIPFARYLLQRGTAVTLAANSFPSMNDITSAELVSVISRAAASDECLGAARARGQLRVIGTGNGSPCLDLRRISAELAADCLQTDLVVLVGMGRAIHTNFNAEFSCDSLKVAVFKDQQVASAVGACMYDGMCVFRPAHRAHGEP